MKKKIIIISIIFLTLFFIGISIHKNKVKKERKIIEYCEEYKWRRSYKYDCKNLLHLKPNVKKSRSNICHEEESTYYYKTKIYKKYDSIKECLNSGGRLPYN
jgi:hypothetical protein